MSEINKKVEAHLKSAIPQEAKVWSKLVNFSQKMLSASPAERPPLPQVKMFCASLSNDITRLPLSSNAMDSDDEIEINSDYGGIVDDEPFSVHASGDGGPHEDVYSRVGSTDSRSAPSLDSPIIVSFETPARKLKRSILDAVDAYQTYHHKPSCCCTFFSRHGSAGIKRTTDLKDAISDISPDKLTIDAIKRILGDFFKKGSCFCPGTAKAANNNHSFIRYFIEKLHANFVDSEQPTINNSINKAMIALEIQGFVIPEATPQEDSALLNPIYSSTFKAISESCMSEFAAFRLGVA